ncbi:MAG: SDR family oxidoreductase [Yaniella sp.]|uniref:SDR family NAD(P)-dependent oxidoreductase n=1 Tax=Yaniella sp. TaxID=2773929 RepID=UPI002648C8E9|nr:SDR family NAD(P)-dependent oxidoreductase [Yaniella sp.]MDN5704162.1 SDR family oxidoreductase [Yaniella sp.]MDN5731497.1 SDR family oxidoreductase [Yaniella sp.]MDN5742457.1 SDR family oxidoreductase [Yaniella sp.]MDN5815364.1 SDR family oxidoreductase [Yaniella sp.]MDN5817032.1 SDR family oxidoreductase [Yaniella sp.]
MKLQGRVGIVTGAGSGMGKAAVDEMTAQGATVYAVDLREDALAEAFGNNESVRSFAADVTDSARLAEIISALEQEQGRLDVLVNAAGVSTPNREKQQWVDGINHEMIQAAQEGREYHPDFLSGISDEDFQRVVEINLHGTFFMIREAAPLLKQTGGSIINFASVAGLMGLPMPAYYPASKAAVVGMTKAVAAELAPFNIRVNALAPAGINTAMFAASGEDHMQALLALQPLKRVAEPEEIGKTVLFLASDESGHYTGQTFSPSGGAVMV